MDKQTDTLTSALLGVVHILRRQLGGREVFAKSLRLSTRGREGYSKCLRIFFLKYFTVTLFWRTLWR